MLCDILARAGNGQLHGAESVLGSFAEQFQFRRAEIKKRGKRGLSGTGLAFG